MKPVKQTGLIFKFSPLDFITGASPIPYEEVNPLGDWRDFLPSEEKQFKDFSFDTVSCTTFSAINCVETQINFFLKNKKFSPEQEAILAEYKDEKGKVNFSDRFTAIMSGTTPTGNYHQKVWDSIRTDGLLPEKDFPFGGNNWNEYHDKTKITEEMKTKAKKILGVLSFAYEWNSFEPNADLSKALKQVPVHGAIPVPATHAVELPSANYIFDTYPPFLYERMKPVHYSFKGVVKIIPPPIQSPYKYFKETEGTGLGHTFAELDTDFKKLIDKMRGECGFPWILNSGRRTKAQNDALPDAVSDSAHLDGLAVDIACTDSTRRDKIISVAKANGIKRIGIGKTFIHIDVSKTLPQNVMWLYN